MNRSSAYQYSFNASCISRDVRWKSAGWPAEVIVPAAAFPIDALGFIELGRVEQVEDFGAELKAAIFSRREREILEEGRIDLLCSGPNQYITSGISKCVLSG